MNQNHKFKTLLIAPSPPPVGGIQSWTENIISYYQKQSQYQLSHVDTVVKYRGILEIELWQRIIAGIRVTIDLMKNVRQSIQSEKPDVIHLTSSASLALFKDCRILHFANKHHIPLVIHWHFGRIPELAAKKNWEWRLITYLIRKSACSIVIDAHSHKSLIEAGFKNVVNIANPISDQLMQLAIAQKGRIRKPEKGKVLFVGHVFENKGVFELVQACVDLPSVKHLKLVGPVQDEVKQALETMAKKRENGKWLEIAGSKTKEEVFTEIGSAELIALPSYTEGFPISIIEAMSLGCPVVATNVGAIPEMLNIKSQSPAGVCVKVRDIANLKASLESVLLDDNLKITLGQNGINQVLKNFTPEIVYHEYQQAWLGASKTDHINNIKTHKT